MLKNYQNHMGAIRTSEESNTSAARTSLMEPVLVRPCANFVLQKDGWTDKPLAKTAENQTLHPSTQ